MHDLFVSHASEDKELFVRPLARALTEAGVDVWYDEFALKIGDSLRRSIDAGLASSRFGLVVLSPHFFNKYKECSKCGGDGLCPNCEGHGGVVDPVFAILTMGLGSFSRFTCSVCDGNKKCPVCKGDGKVEAL